MVDQCERNSKAWVKAVTKIILLLQRSDISRDELLMAYETKKLEAVALLQLQLGALKLAPAESYTACEKSLFL